MGQPKAKWSEDFDGEWEAIVGHHVLAIHQRRGIADIWSTPDAKKIWVSEPQPLPCDITHLMRLAEAELERRLRVTADTMDGTELVAERESPNQGVSVWDCSPLYGFEDCDKRAVGHPHYCDEHAREHAENVAKAKRDNPLYISETCIGCRGAGYVVVGGHQKQFCHACHGLGSHTRPATPDEERAMPTTAQGGEVRYADSGPNGPIAQASTKWASRCNPSAHMLQGERYAVPPAVGSRDWAIAELQRPDVECDRWLVDREGGSWKRGYSCRYMRFVGFGEARDTIPKSLTSGWHIET